jgi:trimeric autotransporter adhesin
MPRSVSGQTYKISTVAGGALPINVQATSATLDPYVPQYLTADQTGNLFFIDQHAVLRFDSKTATLSLVAGNGTTGFSGDNGPATSAQLSFPLGIAVDPAGNVYIADSGNYRIRKVSNGVITTVAGNGLPGFSGDGGPATSARLSISGGIAVDGAGNLYIVSGGRIRKVSEGVITTVAGNPSGTIGDGVPAISAVLLGVQGIAVGPAGNIYIAEWTNIISRVREVSNGIITTIAGNGTQGFSGDNGPATRAQLSTPVSLAADQVGNIYIADYQNSRVRKVSNGVITTIAGNGTAGFGGDNGPAIGAQLNGPSAVAVDSAGMLYIADIWNHRIRKVANGAITTVIGGGPQASRGDGGPATNAQIANPSGVAVDGAGNIYVADSLSNSVRKVSNGVITTVAGDGTQGFGGDNGPAVKAQLDHPSGVAVDSAGNVYIADTNNMRIRKISKGVISTFAGVGMYGSSGFGGDNGPATDAQLASPFGIAADSADNIYIADTNNGRIRKVSGGIITTVAGGGFSDLGDNGPANGARLIRPMGVAVDGAGNLYIADAGDHRVRKTSNGIIATVAGNGVAGFAGDNASAATSQLNSAVGVVVDAAGALYIADSGNNRIRKVSNGVITTVAGNGVQGFSGDGGPAASAQLSVPGGLALDLSGNIYVADSDNNRIRVLTPVRCTYSVTPASLQIDASGGISTVAIQTAASCSWTISGLPSWITVSGASSGVGSSAAILNIAPNSGAQRTATISIESVSLQVAQQPGISRPSIYPRGVVNAASSLVGSPVAPGTIATAYGSFPVSGLTTASGPTLPNNLAGLSIELGGGLAAPLFAVTGGQVNFQVPWELAGQSQTSLFATVNGQTSAIQTVSLASFAPGIFSMNGQGNGQGAILDASYRLVDSSNPATTGSTVIQVYCTGLGPVTNPQPTGLPASAEPLSLTTTTPILTVGGVQATVLFSGLAPGTVGEYQVNAIVPVGSPKGAAVPVVVTVGGATSNTVTIAVQ